MRTPQFIERIAKRTTVTTIETHEVWIIRRVAPGSDEAITITPFETEQPDVAVSPATELTNDSETSEAKS